MADPIMPDFYRAMAVFHHVSGVAEHRFVNSFVFQNEAVFWPTQDAMADASRDALDDFYFGLNGGATTIASRMPWAQIPLLEYRVYDLGETPPRTPFIRAPAVTVPTSGATALPYEVSAVLSLRTALRDRAGRGRLFIGPLTQANVVQQDGGPAIGAELRTAMVNAATGLMNTSHNVSWCVLSSQSAKHAPEAREIVGGYVDHAWDTQRRRGWLPAGRDEFGVVL